VTGNRLQIPDFLDRKKNPRPPRKGRALSIVELGRPKRPISVTLTKRQKDAIRAEKERIDEQIERVIGDFGGRVK
jgi:hypothetical protein